MNASEIARSGLQANAARQAVSAHNIANMNTDGFAKQTASQHTNSSGGVSSQVDTISLPTEAQQLAQQVDGAQNNVDLAEESVNQIQSRENFKQNAQIIRTQDEMQKTLIDTVV
jgi:flagellar hook protein FlgE